MTPGAGRRPPRGPAVPRRDRRWPVVLLVLLATTLLAAGCGALSALIDTQQSLQNAGYQSVHVGFHANGQADDVDVGVTVSAAPTQADSLNVASVVWAHLHERFDYLDVTVHGTGPSVTTDYSFGNLQQTFGPRNPSWDKTTVAAGTEQLGFIIIGAIAAIGVTIAVVAILVTRARRRRRGPPGWPGGQGPAGRPGVQGPAGWPGGTGPAGGVAPGYPMWPPPPQPPRPAPGPSDVS
jgi:hypothetical protein